mgnify:FL=1
MTKTARKAKKASDSPTPTPTRQFAAMDVDEFEGVSRRRVSSYLPVVQALLDLPKGKGLFMKAPNPEKVEDYRTSLYASLRSAMKQLGKDVGIRLSLSKDRTGFMLTVREA